MKKYLYGIITAIVLCNDINGMLLDSNRKVELCLDTQAKVAIINNRTQFPIPFKESNHVISLVIPISENTAVEDEILSLLTTLDSETFGIKPKMDFILTEDAIAKFNNELFSRLGNRVSSIFFRSQNNQQKSLIEGIINCNNFIARNYLKFLTEIPESDIETFKAKKTSIESYYNNVSQKIEMLVSILSPGLINQDEQYKIVSIALMQIGNELYNKTFRERATVNQKIILDEYDEDCINRAIALANLATQRKITLNANECYIIAKILDTQYNDSYLLLNNLSNCGLSTMKAQKGVFCRPDLQSTVDILQSINVNDLKTNSHNLLPYIATMYCLSNIDNLSFPMSAYESLTESDDALRKIMVQLAKTKLEQLLQSEH